MERAFLFQKSKLLTYIGQAEFLKNGSCLPSLDKPKIPLRITEKISEKCYRTHFEKYELIQMFSGMKTMVSKFIPNYSFTKTC
jgi:hypothetical protein